MFFKYSLPLLSIVGVALAIYTVRASNVELAPAQPVAPPPQARFETKVAGAGLIEASTENIAVGTLVPGVVAEVMVKVGDIVKAGQPLFRLDDRELQAQLRVAQSNLDQAVSRLNLLKQQPRAEDVPPLEAGVMAAKARLDNARREAERLARVGASASRDEIDRARLDLESESAGYDRANAELNKMKAGAWKPEVEVADAQVAEAQAQVDSAKIEIDRRTVLAPIDGTLLQVKVRRGEFAQVGPLSQPLMLIGDIETLHIRVDIDENDAWRVRPDAAAQAFVRGNSSLKTELKFVRIEPYVIPKRSLTGESSERVDTRVLQVVYAFNRADFEKANGGFRVYTGQQMDIYLDAPATSGE